MKKILVFAVAAIAACAAFTKPKPLSKAEIEKRDKANWGGVDYSAAPDGENSVANDLAQMRSMTRGEAAKFKKLHDFCKDLYKASKIIDTDPGTVLGDALKDLGRPIDPTPQRMLTNLSATPAQKLAFKSLQGAKNTLAKFGKDVRPKVAVLLRAELETRLYSEYNHLVRVVNLGIIQDGSLVKSLTKVDTAWGKYVKLFAAVLKESGLDCALDADGNLHAKSSRYLHTLDSYFKRTTDADLKKFEEAINKCWVSHNEAVDALDKFKAWFAETGMSIDPYPRELVKELCIAYANYIHKNCDVLEDCNKILAALRDESQHVGKLRKCKGISPNKAYFLRSGPVSERPPAYVRRTNELRLEAKARFEAAVKRRIDTAGRIQI